MKGGAKHAASAPAAPPAKKAKTEEKPAVPGASLLMPNASVLTRGSC